MKSLHKQFGVFSRSITRTKFFEYGVQHLFNDCAFSWLVLHMSTFFLEKQQIIQLINSWTEINLVSIQFERP